MLSGPRRSCLRMLASSQSRAVAVSRRPLGVEASPAAAVVHFLHPSAPESRKARTPQAALSMRSRSEAMRLPTRDTNRAVLFARAIQERPHADGIGGSHAGSRMCAAASRNLASPWKPASPSIDHRQAVVGARNKWPSARPPPMRGANARKKLPTHALSWLRRAWFVGYHPLPDSLPQYPQGYGAFGWPCSLVGPSLSSRPNKFRLFFWYLISFIFHGHLPWTRALLAQRSLLV